MKKSDRISITVGFILFIAAAFFSFSLLMQLLYFGSGLSGFGGFLFRLGEMLFSVYGFTSILIPVFLGAAAVLCFMSDWTEKKGIYLFTSIIPFFTAVFAEKICRLIFSTANDNFTIIKIISVLIISFLVIIIEYLIIGIISDKVLSQPGKDIPIERNFIKEPDMVQERTNTGNPAVAKESKLEEISPAAYRNKDLDRDGKNDDAGISSEPKKDELISEEDISIETGDTTADEDRENSSGIWDLETVWGDKEDSNAVEEQPVSEEKEPYPFDHIFDGNFENVEGTEDVQAVKDEDAYTAFVLPESEKPAAESKETVKPANEKEDDFEYPDFLEDETDQDQNTAESESENVSLEDLDLPVFTSSAVSDEQSGNPFPELNENPENETEENLDFPPFITPAASEEQSKDSPPDLNEITENQVDEGLEDLKDLDIDYFNGNENVQTSDIPEETDKEENPEIKETLLPDPDFDGNSENEQEQKVPIDNLFQISTSENEEMPSENENVLELKEEAENVDEDNQGEEPFVIPADIQGLTAASDVFSRMEDDAIEEALSIKNGEQEETNDDEDPDDIEEEDEEDIPVEKTKLPEITTDQRIADRKLWKGPYRIPTDTLLETYEDDKYWIIDDETKKSGELLKATLKEFNIDAEVIGIRKGPVVTMFEILPAPGVRLSKIVNLQDNIALRLAASSVRIVAPIPGKRAVGIEVPNKERSIVSFKEIIEQNIPQFRKMAVPVILGKDIQGEAQVVDLVKMPHLLIAGATGSGKSVCVNSLILSILYKRSPRDVKLILIDPKIVELKLYNDIPHLLTPVITEPKRAFQSLQYCLCEMERRYALLDGMGVRDVTSYNKKIIERNIATEKLPYIIVIIDEFADLMATTGKEMESIVARLAAMSRAIGIHLVLATQRPSIDVITGLIKANIPSRIAFMVASKMDSRIIIDQIGAEKLLGKGDMLYSSTEDPFPIRIQGTFVSDGEVEKVVEYVKQFGEPDYIDDEIFVDDDEDAETGSLFNDGEDPLYDDALNIVVEAGKASASYLQRKLKIGYNRAARIVEEMEDRGIIGPANGSKPREIIHVP